MQSLCYLERDRMDIHVQKGHYMLSLGRCRWPTTGELEVVKHTLLGKVRGVSSLGEILNGPQISLIHLGQAEKCRLQTTKVVLVLSMTRRGMKVEGAVMWPPTTPLGSELRFQQCVSLPSGHLPSNEPLAHHMPKEKRTVGEGDWLSQRPHDRARAYHDVSSWLGSWGYAGISISFSGTQNVNKSHGI